MSKTNNKTVGFNSFLLLLFIGLKLGGVIDWSWWWVLSPIWIPICIAFVLFVIYELFKPY